MSKEAMKQMVSSLERIDLWLKARYSGIGLVGDEIAALEAGRQAIAEAEQEPVALQDDEIYDAAYSAYCRGESTRELFRLMWNSRLTCSIGWDREELKSFARNIAALYTSPQPKAEQKPYGYLKLNTGRFVNEVEGLNPMKDKQYLPLYTHPQPKAEQRQAYASKAEQSLYEQEDDEDERTQPKAEQEPVAVKRMLEWSEGLKRLSDNGHYMNIPSELSAGTCYQIGVDIEQFCKHCKCDGLSDHPQPKPLTEEEINARAKTEGANNADFWAGVRFAEEMHKVKE